MRVLADDQYNELNSRIKALEEENRHLKMLLDDAGIAYAENLREAGTFEPHEHEPNRQYAAAAPNLTTAIKEEPITRELVQFFYSMFRGRKDVYSLRSAKPNPKTGKHSYYPQCANIWNPALCKKTVDKKAKCSECHNQRYKELSGNVLAAHLRGIKNDCSDVVGMYPVMPDGTCNFLVFDFDNHDESSQSLKWQEEASALRQICENNKVPCLVERSRSGKGAHVWLFFDAPVDAKKARQFGAALLDKGAESVNQISFDTYDRMLPAQDKIPAGKLGNLVALPLQGRALKNGNSAFVDDGWNPYHDQWEALKRTSKISPSFIDEKMNQWGNRFAGTNDSDIKAASGQISIDEAPWENKAKFDRADVKDTVRIIAADGIYIDKSNLASRLQNKIRRLAAYNNPEYFKKQAMGIPTFGIPRIMYSGNDTDQYITIPRGCLDNLCTGLKNSEIDFTIEDKRNKGRKTAVSFKGNLFPEQEDAARRLLEHDIGILAAATGFGKTAVGAYLIATRKVNTLVLVHTNEIMQNWINDLNRFLEINEELPQYQTKSGRTRTRKSLIGRLTGSHDSLTGIIDVAMVSSLGSKDEIKPYVKNYGMVIMDECHHGAAESIGAVLSEVNAKYVYGLTATVKREDGKDKTVLMQFGPVRYRFTAKDKNRLQGIRHVLEPRFTPVVSEKKKLTANEAYETIVNSDIRNNMIAADITTCVSDGHTPLVLSKRKAQLNMLFEKLEGKADHVFVLTGGKTQSERNAIRETLNSIPEDESMIILATGQYIGEGFNCPRLDTLFLAMPVAWDGNVEQYTGRLNRTYAGKDKVTVIDYVDHNIEIFANMYNKRLRTYKRIGYELSSDIEQSAGNEFFFDSETYYGTFSKDITGAKKEIIISSHYVSSAGSDRLIRALSSPLASGVPVTLITFPSSHYSEDIKPRIDTIHRELASAGIRIQIVENISSRFAVIDGEILWYGSMNLASSIKDNDDEMRIVNKAIIAALIDGLKD